MISITEKTADKICQEFREMIQAVDKKLEEESKQFQDLTNAFNEFNEKDGLKYDLAKTLYDGVTKDREELLSTLNETKEKYIGFIEVLMVGESA